jgi:hypothetical protein
MLVLLAKQEPASWKSPLDYTRLWALAILAHLPNALLRSLFQDSVLFFWYIFSSSGCHGPTMFVEGVLWSNLADWLQIPLYRDFFLFFCLHEFPFHEHHVNTCWSLGTNLQPHMIANAGNLKIHQNGHWATDPHKLLNKLLA